MKHYHNQKTPIRKYEKLKRSGGGLKITQGGSSIRNSNSPLQQSSSSVNNNLPGPPTLGVVNYGFASQMEEVSKLPIFVDANTANSKYFQQQKQVSVSKMYPKVVYPGLGKPLPKLEGEGGVVIGKRYRSQMRSNETLFEYKNGSFVI